MPLTSSLKRKKQSHHIALNAVSFMPLLDPHGREYGFNILLNGKAGYGRMRPVRRANSRVDSTECRYVVIESLFGAFEAASMELAQLDVINRVALMINALSINSNGDQSTEGEA